MKPASAQEQKAIEEAALWYARLLPGAAELRGPAQQRQQQEQAFAAWLAADPLHAQAWARVQALGQRMAKVPAGIALSTLDRPGPARRPVLRALALLLLAGGGAALGWRQLSGRAAQVTALGERRRLELADGSALELDSQTALDVDFHASERALRLRQGAILVTTRPDPAQPTRPFVVYTPQARILALGTRFEVRVAPEASTVTVLEHAVQVSPLGQPGAAQRVQAGQRLRVQRAGVGAIEASAPGAGAWAQGRLVVWDRPLAEVAAELARYRRGWLSCDPAVAGLRVSGVLPLDDTDQALASLAESFALRIERDWTGLRTRIAPRAEPR
ncbi:MAG: FecR domain-containing protein [Comamonadaceae bacterium]|nr:FecR domain-containing protein [Comamonadaceae bacterium]